MRFDDILGELGSFGPYQRRVYLVVCLMAASTAFHSMTQVFIAGTTDHWCKTDYWDANCSEWNLSPTDCKEAKKNGSIPVSYGDDSELVYDQCYMYNITGIEFDPSYDPSMNGTASTIPCQDGWEHDKSQLKSSIIQDWDLVCDKKHLPDYAQSVFYSGYLFGSIFFGVLADNFIPESARWLLSHGNGEKAEKIIRKVAKVNKRKLPDPLFTEDEIQKLEVVSMVPKASIFDLFRTPVLRWRTINFIYNWMVNNIVYYGLTYSSGDLGFNVHLNFFLSGAVEIVGYVLAIFTIDFFGRRPSIATFLIIGGCSCLINIGIPIGTWNTVVALTGKSAISASYTIVYVYSAECFPTPVRSIGIGICSMMARVGTIVSPMILILGDYYYPAPLIIFGTTAITAGFLSFFFPETRGMRLPETIEEGETLGTKAKDDNSAGL
eukprot:XP_011683641.1 PREDICTED: solute carrier family 22 member 5 isoform X2 [Strongylocentrotus purpuratus]